MFIKSDREMCLPMQMFALEGVCVGASYKSCKQPFWTAYLFCQKHSIFKPKLHQSQLPRFFELTYIIANHFYTIEFVSRWILFMKTDTSPDAKANARQLRIFVVLIVNIFLSLGLVFSSDACWTEFRMGVDTVWGSHEERAQPGSDPLIWQDF